MADPDTNWIKMTDILPFRRMRDLDATSADFVDALKNSLIGEVDATCMYIRRKESTLIDDFQILGFDK